MMPRARVLWSQPDGMKPPAIHGKGKWVDGGGAYIYTYIPTPSLFLYDITISLSLTHTHIS